MKTNKSVSHSPIKELCGFGLGCLVGGLTGVGAGLWCQTEVAIITSYAIGFLSGGFLGALITRRLTR
ncbi:hypothetical protein N9B38_00425 [bacterium]|nr:hypothetical protein [bacterium]